MRAMLRAAVVAIVIGAAAAAPAWADAADEFKAELDTLFATLGPATKGKIVWDGADRFDVRRDGDAVVATLVNGRITVVDFCRVEIDKIELRRGPKPGDDTRLVFESKLPGRIRLIDKDGDEIKVTFKESSASAEVEKQNESVRHSRLSIRETRLEHPKSGFWLTFGTIDGKSDVEVAADGSWSAPGEFGIADVEFFVPEAPLSGSIGRVGYSVKATGREFPKLEAMRAELQALRNDHGRSPEQRLAELLKILPGFPAVFNELRGEFSVDGVAARAVSGEKLVALRKASMTTVLKGLSESSASLRISLGHEGLELAPAVAPSEKVPSRFVLDFGLEDVATAPLVGILEALPALDSSDPAEKSRATNRMMGAAAMLAPVFRIYEAGVDTPDAGAEATATAKGSPLSPKGYTAEGDLVVRGANSLAGLFGGMPGIEWLPLAIELGKESKAKDGSARLAYHFASEPQKWLTLNGSDVTPLIGGDGPEGQRVLKPHMPPMRGDDVKAAQRALIAAKLKVPEDGVYNATTAVAVARFQKQNALAINGAVDAATKQKLAAMRPEPAGGGGGIGDVKRRDPAPRGPGPQDNAIPDLGRRPGPPPRN